MSRSVTMDYDTLRERETPYMRIFTKPEPVAYGPGAHQGYCWPSLGEPCGECHRCDHPAAPEQELADDYERNEH